jgi:hypothetical protein
VSRIDELIAQAFEQWGEEASIDLKNEAELALQRAGRSNPNTISLEFDKVIATTSDGNVSLEIRAKRIGKPAPYWRYIEEGRRAGKQPPADKFGKAWQNEQGIDARVVLLKIQAKRKRGLKTGNRRLKRVAKGLNYDSAVRSLSFLIARSIGRKGLRPKPFVGKVLTDERIADLRNRLTPLLGEKYKLIIKGLNE